jgi:ATP-dependent Lon protease
MPGDRLPLFPLNVVLFPASSLPLHIFEERYKTLIRECMGRGTDFGINFLRAAGMAEVGCTATVVRLTRTYEDGRMDVVVRGERIYRLAGLADDPAPYAVGAVDYLTDLQRSVDPELADQVIQLFSIVQRLASREGFSADPLSGEVPRLSFIVAQKSGLDLDERQTLLEMRDENERLEMLRRHLETLIPLLEQKDVLDQLKQNDGYL